MNRLGIMVLFDKDGIVDDYVYYLLKEIKTVVSKLMIVSNSFICDLDIEKLKVYTHEIVLRENKGFDAGAWQDALLNYVGIENLVDYDELVLLNDTFFGPFYPFEKIFIEMDSKDIDFWGMTIHGSGTLGDDGPAFVEHIQSYFLVVREKLLHSHNFSTYWKNLKVYDTYTECVLYNEVYFTEYFNKAGFKYTAYCDTRTLEKYNVKKINHWLFNYYDLLTNFHCPIIKKKALGSYEKSTTLIYNHADEIKRSLDYIEKNYDYDVKMIYKNIVRTYDISYLQENFNLNYILSSKYYDQNFICKEKVCFICHIYYEDMINYCLHFIKSLPDFIDIYITTNTQEKKTVIENTSIYKEKNITCRLVNARGRDLSALFIGCNDLLNVYDYIGFIHDKKSLRDGHSITEGNTFRDILFNNIVLNYEYIMNLLKLFDEEKSLGVLVPPSPCFAEYRLFNLNYWTINKDNTINLLNKMGIQVPIDEKQGPLAIGSAFWIKKEAIKQLLEIDWRIELFSEEPMANDGTFSHALERCFSYVAQANGFYTGIVMNEEYAAAEISNFKYLYKDKIRNKDFNEKIVYKTIGLREALSNYFHKYLPKFICNIIDKFLFAR